MAARYYWEQRQDRAEAWKQLEKSIAASRNWANVSRKARFLAEEEKTAEAVKAGEEALALAKADPTLDDDVAACMMEHNALAVLSLDGYMAVDIDAGSLAAGDEVSVTVGELCPSAFWTVTTSQVAAIRPLA